MNKTIKMTLLRWKYTLAAVILLILITLALVLSWFNKEQKSDPASEKIIREAAAYKLNKDAKDLTDDDFAKIKILHFGKVQNYPGPTPSIDFMLKEITEISLIGKFTNLQKLNLFNIRFKVPKWMKFLANFGIIDLEDRFAIDLSPLASLSNLQVLNLEGCPIKNIEPLSRLTNLKILDVSNTSISDIEPLKNLSNLQWVLMAGCENITEKQVEDLQKALPNLSIEYIKIAPPDMFTYSMGKFEDYLPESELENGE